MTDRVVRIHPEESVSVAARSLTIHNIGMLPVCGNDGRVCGVVTDRDLVTRCIASGRNPAATPVRDVMSANVVSAVSAMTTEEAARLMGSRQIRRLPVVENGKLCGMVSLGDLANRKETDAEAGKALSEISNHLSQRD
jgi:CBS domain-containing protein